MAEIRVKFFGIGNLVDGHRVAEVVGKLNDRAFLRVPYSVKNNQELQFTLHYNLGASITLGVFSTLDDMDQIKDSTYTNYTWVQVGSPGLTTIGSLTVTGPITGLRLDFGGSGANSGRVRCLF